MICYQKLCVCRKISLICNAKLVAIQGRSYTRDLDPAHHYHFCHLVISLTDPATCDYLVGRRRRGQTKEKGRR